MRTSLRAILVLIVAVLLATALAVSAPVSAQSENAGYPFDTPGGPVEFNSARILEYGAQIAVTVNLYDGTTVIWDLENGEMVPLWPDREIYEFYAVIGRRLKTNGNLNQLYQDSDFSGDGSWYDGQHGVLWNDQGIPRSTYTPLFAGNLYAFNDTPNFGQIGGHTDIGTIHRFFEVDGVLAEAGTNSNYTLHRVPQGTPDQEILLREPDLRVANSFDSLLRGPMEFPTLNRSSGCINYDAPTWLQFKSIIQAYINDGKLVVAVFSVPGVDQDLLFTNEAGAYMISDPLSNVNISTWGYDEALDLTFGY